MRLDALSLLLVLAGCATLKPSQGPLLRLENVHVGGVTAIAFNAQGSLLASGGHDGATAVWRVPDGGQVSQGKPHGAAVRGLAWLKDSAVLSVAEDGRIAVWSLDGEVLRQTEVAPVTGMVWDESSRSVVTIHDDFSLREFDAQSLRERGRVQFESGLTAIALDVAAGKIAVATAAEGVVILNRTLAVQQRFSAPRKVYGLAFSPDGRFLAGGSWFQLQVWDLERGVLETRDTEHFGAIIALDYSNDGNELATIGRHTDGMIRIVGADDNHVERRLLAHDACGWSVRMGPNGRFLATASEDESIRLYDLQAPYEPRFSHAQ